MTRAAEVKLQHTSGQFSDNLAEHHQFAQAVFHRAQSHNVWLATGTEAGKSDVNHGLRSELILAAHEHGFFIYANPHGEWVALNRTKLNLKDMTGGYEGPFIEGHSGKGAHSPRGITYASGEAKQYNLGLITMGAVHFLTERSIEAGGVTNAPLQDGISDFGFKFGGGSKIVFIDADSNMRDHALDVFDGAPFTTAADELDKHPATHGASTKHGNDIDFIASFDRDGRVTCKSYEVHDDRTFPSTSDHFLLEAVYEVRELAG
jgi:hypothetical protein